MSCRNEPLVLWVGKQQCRFNQYQKFRGNSMKKINPPTYDPLFLEAALLIVTSQQGSSSLLQRKLLLGYNRAGVIMDQLEETGIVGPFGDRGRRKVMFTDVESLEIFFSKSLKIKLLQTKIHPHASKQTIKIACFKNIIEILIPEEEHKVAYLSAIENLISADDLYKDFLNLLTRLYFWQVTNTVNTDNIWPFHKVNLSNIGTKNLIKLLEKKTISRSEENTREGRGSPLADINYTFCQLTFSGNSIMCYVETEKIPTLDFNCRIAGMELKVVENQLNELVNKLNRLYALRSHERADATVYRAYRLKKAFQEFFEQVAKQYEIIPFDCISNYEKLLGEQLKLRKMIEDKEAAVQRGDYETAASIRDQEKALIYLRMSQKGLNGSDRFFYSEGKIFYKIW